MRLEWEKRKPPELVLDKQRVLEAMANEARAIFREPGRLPSRTGEFADSVDTEIEADGSISVGPTGERNLTIARVFARRGEALFELSPNEVARITAAAQAEINRQAKE